MDVKALQARLAAFAQERGWDDVQNPRNLAIALAGEAGMLLDLFRWLTDAQSHRIESEYKREAAEEAIADLVLHALRLADKLGIDVERAVAKKLAENDANYPRPVPEAVTRAIAPVQEPVAEKAVAPLVVTGAAAPPAAQAEPETPIARPPEPPATPQPVEAKKPPRPEPVAPAAPEGAQRTPEPRPPPDKALPTWLDGILPARSGPARKKSGPKAAPEPAKAAEPPRPREVARAPEAKPRPVAEAPPPAAERIEAAAFSEAENLEIALPPEVEADAAPARAEPTPERYAHLDTDAAKVFAKALAKRVDGARSDDPLLRELHDEVETLRRTLYSPTPKRSWIGDTLRTLRALLEEAATREVGEALRAHDYIAQIDRMLAR